MKKNILLIIFLTISFILPGCGQYRKSYYPSVSVPDDRHRLYKFWDRNQSYYTHVPVSQYKDYEKELRDKEFLRAHTEAETKRIQEGQIPQ